jgi:exopolysaccharide biosynthesis WecB/TagA/CpsF family protein
MSNDTLKLRSLPRRHDLFGVRVSATSYDELVERIIERGLQRQPTIVDFMCVHGLVHAAQHETFKRVINDFDVVATDGQPVRWALNWFHRAGLKSRVYGPETMWRTCAAAEKAGVAVYLYGSSPEVIASLPGKLLEAFPRLRIVGAESPPFRPLTAREDAEVAGRINASGAGIVFIGTGCPRQEEFAWRQRHAIRAVQMCVGAAFDLHAGVKRMAPGWMQRHGLEWLYRLVQEPSRLWKRYLVNNTVFVALAVRQALTRRTRPSVEADDIADPVVAGHDA